MCGGIDVQSIRNQCEERVTCMRHAYDSQKIDAGWMLDGCGTDLECKWVRLWDACGMHVGWV